MKKFQTISDVRQCVEIWRREGERIAFVPTMGNLHEGHLTLVREAKRCADRVIVSIFVNPTQFGINEDFSNYPRTEVDDCLKLLNEDCDAVFLPSVQTLYSPNAKTSIHVAGVSEHFCGASRSGHFSGVATIVCKLFNIVEPHCALFGLKDFQQFVVIQTLVHDLNLPIDIIGVPTVREQDGLAMSSRNGYLSAKEREVAPQLYETLQLVRDRLMKESASFEQVQEHAIAALTQYGFIIDYFSVARRADLVLARKNDNELIILVAAKLGKTRLIDNLWLDK
ncbi:MAG: hypothetical protein RLZZ384_284 [Pseudomonadota bacterium]